MTVWTCSISHDVSSPAYCLCPLPCGHFCKYCLLCSPLLSTLRTFGVRREWVGWGAGIRKRSHWPADRNRRAAIGCGLQAAGRAPSLFQRASVSSRERVAVLEMHSRYFYLFWSLWLGLLGQQIEDTELYPAWTKSFWNFMQSKFLSNLGFLLVTSLLW